MDYKAKLKDKKSWWFRRAFKSKLLGTAELYEIWDNGLIHKLIFFEGEILNWYDVGALQAGDGKHWPGRRAFYDVDALTEKQKALAEHLADLEVFERKYEDQHPYYENHKPLLEGYRKGAKFDKLFDCMWDETQLLYMDDLESLDDTQT